MQWVSGTKKNLRSIRQLCFILMLRTSSHTFFNMKIRTLVSTPAPWSCLIITAYSSAQVLWNKNQGLRRKKGLRSAREVRAGSHLMCLYFHVVLFTVPHKVVLAFDSVNKTLVNYHSNENYFQVALTSDSAQCLTYFSKTDSGKLRTDSPQQLSLIPAPYKRLIHDIYITNEPKRTT